ncbi:MAG: tRNA (adenosine(37)-N6)-threonylcarbamoyltransferase complex dimerization subunit type 1 TsaB [Caldisericum exile]|uniref:tRNA (adenosine(37)-N6)-threonylcarbamoyltransferase complex dimerization subunit type 1 TsaB n=1 Tax=Caldisericum exile TaxID=693075 RepID=UPI003C74F5F1
MNYLFLSQAFYPTISLLGNDEKILYSVIQYPNDESPNNLLYITKTMFDILKFEKRDLTHILVVNGPGSFTGTRIGVVDAKILSFALNIPLIPVNSLELISRHVGNLKIKAVLSAGRNEFFVAEFENGARSSPDEIKTISELQNLEGDLIVSFEDLSYANLKNFKKIFVDPEVIHSLALLKISRGEQIGDPLSLKPIYLRAEDKLFKKMR